MDLDLSPVLDHLADLEDGLQLTIELAAAAWIASALIGVAAVVLRLAGPAVATGLVVAYVDVIRGVPSLILVLACFYLLPEVGLRLAPAQSGLAALSLYYGAYFAEAMRGALATVPPGQREAAAALGLRPATILRRVVLPQAIGPMTPPLAGLTIGLVKETALLSVISVPELVFAGKEAISDSYAPFEIYAFVALCYWAVNTVVAGVATWLERKATTYRTHLRPKRERTWASARVLLLRGSQSPRDTRPSA